MECGPLLSLWQQRGNVSRGHVPGRVPERCG